MLVWSYGGLHNGATKSWRILKVNPAKTIDHFQVKAFMHLSCHHLSEPADSAYRNTRTRLPDLLREPTDNFQGLKSALRHVRSRRHQRWTDCYRGNALPLCSGGTSFDSRPRSAMQNAFYGVIFSPYRQTVGYIE
jgi:hypothetical protein